MKRILLIALLLGSASCHRRSAETIISLQSVYSIDPFGEITIYIGSKCPESWGCKSVTRVKVIDQSGVILADIQEK